MLRAGNFCKCGFLPRNKGCFAEFFSGKDRLVV